MPKPVLCPEDLSLPETAGRHYLAVPSATAAMSGGRLAIGTMDGLFAIVSGDGSVFSYGNAAPMGPVRCIRAMKNMEKLYGVAGDVEDVGTVFTFDDKE